MSKRPDLSIVVPVCNEVKNLNLLHSRLHDVLDRIGLSTEMIFVDDGSWDGSRELLREIRQRDPRVKLLLFSRNFGHQLALTAGLDVAEGDAVVIMDADLQDPPELIGQLLDKWKSGYHVVYAVRTRRVGESIWKRASAAIFYRVLSWISRVEIPRNTGDFRLLDRRVVLAFRNLHERTRFLRGLTVWLGFKQTGVEYERPARHAGKTKYSFAKMTRLGVDGILSFSRLPLRLSMYFGICIGFGGICYALFLAVRRLLGAQPVPGWTSTMVAVIIMGSLNLIFLGILGEYVSRIYNEVRERPLYVVQERLGFEDEASGGNRSA